MAKQCHPDKNLNNLQKAADEFNKLSKAYQVLSNGLLQSYIIIIIILMMYVEFQRMMYDEGGYDIIENMTHIKY